MQIFFSEFFFVDINHSINNSTFPEQLKWADVKPVFKKNLTYSGPILENKGTRAIFQKRANNGKTSENLGKKVQHF